MARRRGGVATWPALLAAAALACASLPDLPGLPASDAGPEPSSAAEAAEPGLVSLADLDRTILIDMRYAGAENFTGHPVRGYQAPVCLLTPPAAEALVRVQRELAGEGLGLVVWDCYRPQRAVDQFVRWAGDASAAETQDAYYPAVAKRDLLARGYIAARSSHTRGSTVDAGLVSRGADGNRHLLDMGTPFDFFDPRSHTDAHGVQELHRDRRHRLLRAMERQGFRNFPKEWWHFTLEDEPYPDRYFDVPVASPGSPGA